MVIITNSLQHKNISEQLANLLEEKVLNGSYPVGQRLPAERQLAIDYGVSRPSVRGALKMLVARGLIVTRQGDGNYVSTVLHKSLLSPWESLLQRHDGVLTQDVLEFRRGFEGQVCALAAIRATETDISRLKYWLDKMQAFTNSRDSVMQAQADVSFHQAIAQASHNVLYAQLSSSLIMVLQQETQRNLENIIQFDADSSAVLQRQHTAIYNAIVAHDPELATQSALEHIDYVKTLHENYLLNQQREALSKTLALQDIKKA